MANFLSDLRLSFRVLGKSPGFTAVAIAALALGIGANTAIFSVVNTVLLQPLPYPEPDRIVRVQRSFSGDQNSGGSASIPKFNAWKNSGTFDSMAAYDFSGPGLNLGLGDRPQQVKGIHVSAEYFRVFGVQPAFGRTFLAEEDRPGGPRVAVISHDLWKAQFAGDPALIGQSLYLGGDPYRVVGILPSSFHSDPPAEVFIPLQPDPNSTNQGNYLLVAARLKAGSTIESARAQIKLAGEAYRRQFPDFMDKTEGVGVLTLRDAVVGDVRPALLILVGAVGFVLLIACANVANLLLARATGRQKEIAIRTAVGASRWRVVRQLLTESVILATLGGILGFILGAWGVRLLLALSPGNLPRINAEDHVASLVSVLDWRVLAFTFGISLATGILFGLYPALRVSSIDVNSILKEASGRSGSGMRQNRARSLLVIAEMALAVVLLAGAALMIRTFVGLRNVQPGFDPHHVITMKTSLAGGRYDNTAQVDNMTRHLLQRIETLPGVEFATSTYMLPVEGGIDLPFVIEGHPPANGDKFNGDEQWCTATAHYFSTFRIPLLRGRAFSDRDVQNSAPVMIINQSLAKKYWPKGDPIGARVTIGRGLGKQFEDPTREVVGVVGDVRQTGLDAKDQPVMYLPGPQVGDGMTKLAVNVIPIAWAIRTATDPKSLAAAIQAEFASVDGRLPVSKVRTMEELISETTARQNFNMLLLTIFAGMALLLAAIGIYGLMSYTVEQRMQEIGIRLALGAGQSAMLKLIVNQGMKLVLIGVVIGLAAAFGLTRLLANLLFGVTSSDPVAFAAVAVVLTIVAFFATYIPARRATKVDPLLALRYE